MDNMVEAGAETKGKWNVGGRTLPVIACYVHNRRPPAPSTRPVQDQVQDHVQDLCKTHQYV